MCWLIPDLSSSEEVKLQEVFEKTSDTYYYEIILRVRLILLLRRKESNLPLTCLVVQMSINLILIIENVVNKF